MNTQYLIIIHCHSCTDKSVLLVVKFTYFIFFLKFVSVDYILLPQCDMYCLSTPSFISKLNQDSNKKLHSIDLKYCLLNLNHE